MSNTCQRLKSRVVFTRTRQNVKSTNIYAVCSNRFRVRDGEVVGRDRNFFSLPINDNCLYLRYVCVDVVFGIFRFWDSTRFMCVCIVCIETSNRLISVILVKFRDFSRASVTITVVL